MPAIPVLWAAGLLGVGGYAGFSLASGANKIAVIVAIGAAVYFHKKGAF